jgi:squalene-hopene/tetraprenyl-beta-curcumene cyclase
MTSRSPVIQVFSSMYPPHSHCAQRNVVVIAVLLSLLVSIAPSAPAAPLEGQVGPDRQALASVVDRGVHYLTSEGQADDGSFSDVAGSGVTALATTALLRSGRTVQDPAVAKGLKYLQQCVQPDGGIHRANSRLANYETCVAILCLSEANGDGRYNAILKQAQARVRGLQWDEAKGTEPSNLSYGGVGYGDRGRPDLSNTAFLMDALKAGGAGKDDEAVKRALVFVSRCQNLETEHNSTPFAAKVNDGGFYYTCVLSRQDESRQTPEGGLRSYGTMSYAGLKSLVYAGLTENDPRFKAALGWIRKNYTLGTNPGMGGAGLYYYYHTFAKTLEVLGVDHVEDAQGVKHDWRKDLAEELARRQRPNGSWVNEDTRWFEGDPNLVTSYALLALSHCRAKAEKSQ